MLSKVVTKNRTHLTVQDELKILDFKILKALKIANQSKEIAMRNEQDIKMIKNILKNKGL